MSRKAAIEDRIVQFYETAPLSTVEVVHSIVTGKLRRRRETLKPTAVPAPKRKHRRVTPKPEATTKMTPPPSAATA